MRNPALLLLLLLVLISGCKGQQEAAHHGVNIIEDSQLLAIYERNGYDEVFIITPKGEEVAHYALVPKNDSSSISLPEGATEISVPLERIILDSEVYGGALEDLDSENAIAAMFDASFVTSPVLSRKLKDGAIIDVGNPSSPNLEKIIALKPEAVILSFFEGMNVASFDKAGAPIVKMYDLQESSPVGRAEWIRLLGRLVGKGYEADSIFSSVKENYNNLKKTSDSFNDNKPKVLTELMYQGIWNVAGGKSYQARIIEDAGGKYFKMNDTSNITLNLTPEQVMKDGRDADIWIIRYYGSSQELENVLMSDPVYREMKPFKTNRVFFSDTSKTGLFREFPFHPDLLLQDYQSIFSNDSLKNMRYFELLDISN